MNINIYGTLESGDDNPRRTWQYLGASNSLPFAKIRARTISKNGKWHEIELRAETNGETVCHSYWRNGKLEIDMLS